MISRIHRYLVNRNCGLVAASMLVSIISFAQVRPVPKDTSKKDVILIDHFGKLVEDREGIESVKWISQELQLRIDSTFIYADSAVIYEDRRVFAYKDVVIQQGDSLKVFTDSLFYSRDTDIADLNGEVVLEQGTKQLWTNGLAYDLGNRYGEYHQGGTLIDRGLQVTSKKGIYYARNEEVLFKDDVVVLHPKFSMAADSLRYFGNQSLVVFTGPTNIYTPTAKIYCEGGFYNLETEVAEFNKNAQYAGGDKTATADTIRYDSKAAEVTMSGNVLVIENDRRIESDGLRYLERTGETWITGDPAVYRDSNSFVISPEIFYNERTDLLITKGPSQISDGPVNIKTDQSTYNQSTGLATLKANVEIRDTVQNFGIRAEHIDYSKKTEYMLAHGKSYFFTIIDGDTLFIRADTLNMWTIVDSLANDTLRMMKAYHHVRLFKSDLQGIADSLVFHGHDSTFTFYNDPVLWSDTTQFSADTIVMALENRQLQDIVLQRKAIIISEILGTYYDQIKGKHIVANFDSSAIREMTVTGNAESIYYTRDDRSAFIGVNKTICSKMFFTFDQGEIHLLKYYGDNSSSLLPMHETNHNSMRLEGFQWRADEKPQKADVIQ